MYEIAAPIGAGGMGQVDRATDTTLGREVAIKILPDAFASVLYLVKICPLLTRVERLFER